MKTAIQELIANVTNPTAQNVGLPTVTANQNTAEDILRIVFGVAAALAIIVILIGAFNIVTGGGDPDKISRGKKAVIYALVGLAIAVTAQAIVEVVLGRL